MNEFKDYYSIIGILPSTDSEALDLAYREKAKIYHPDVYSGDKHFSEEEIKKINEAYGVLKDPIKRLEYDHVWSKMNSIELTSTNQIIDFEAEKKRNSDKLELSLKRKRKLDNLIMMWSILAIILVFSLTVLFK